MGKEECTLEELSRMLSIHPRTIRSYIQQGLLRGPDTMGRNARYSEYHIKRLGVIKKLKEDYGLPLSEIRRYITMADPDEEIQIVPLGFSEAKEEGSSYEPEGLSEEPSSALNYIRSRRALSESIGEEPDRGRRRRSAPLPPITSSGPVEKLLVKLRDLVKGRRVPRKARGEEWVRLLITPDIEIHVRGDLSQEQLSGFEQLADLMRHILLGSEDDE